MHLTPKAGAFRKGDGSLKDQTFFIVSGIFGTGDRRRAVKRHIYGGGTRIGITTIVDRY